MTDSASSPAGYRNSNVPVNTQKVKVPKSDEQQPLRQGGELHQTVEDGDDRLTTKQGVTVSNNKNSLRATDRGPLLLEDFVLREKIFHFDHERIPERVVHARGYGAHGHFICTAPIPTLTRAAPFQAENKETPVFVRISSVA